MAEPPRVWRANRGEAEADKFLSVAAERERSHPSGDTGALSLLLCTVSQHFSRSPPLSPSSFFFFFLLFLAFPFFFLALRAAGGAPAPRRDRLVVGLSPDSQMCRGLVRNAAAVSSSEMGMLLLQ